MNNEKNKDTISYFVCKMFNRIESKIEECEGENEMKGILNKYSDKEYFMEVLGNMVNDSVSLFLGLKD